MLNALCRTHSSCLGQRPCDRNEGRVAAHTFACDVSYKNSRPLEANQHRPSSMPSEAARVQATTKEQWSNSVSLASKSDLTLGLA